MKIKGLCIGGHGDGRWIESDSTHLRVPQSLPQMDPRMWLGSPERFGHIELKIDDYVAEPFAITFPNGYTRKWWIWRLSSMSLSDAVDQLFHGYRKP